MGLEMNENEISRIVVDSAFRIHTKLGPGLLESVYQTVMAYELRKRNLQVSAEVEVPLDVGFRIDLLVENLVIVELKSIESVMPIHKKQLLTYLRLMDKRLGLLINFGAPLIKDGICRIANGIED